MDQTPKTLVVSTSRRQWLRLAGVAGAALASQPWLAGRAAAGAETGDLPAIRVRRLEGEPPRQVLFVGNSYFYYNNSLHNHVRRLVDAADPALGRTLAYKSATIGGSPLHHHAIDHYLAPNALGNKAPFDLVILQTVSDAALSAAGRERYDHTIDAFAPKIRAAGARIALYITPAYVKPHKAVDPRMSRLTTEMVIAAADRVGALPIPVGPAFDESYRRRPELSLHQDYDGSHPSLAGSYLAACVVFSALYRLSPVGNRYDYYGRIDHDTTAFLQQVAADVAGQLLGPL